MQQFGSMASYLSDEVLGYQSKLNQLKNLEVEAKKLKRELDSGIKLKDKLDHLLNDAGKQTETLPAIVSAANEASRKTNDELTRTTEVSQKASALLAAIQQNETTSTQQLAATKTSNAEISALEKKVKEFFDQIDEYRT